jgi:hypothetical protein
MTIVLILTIITTLFPYTNSFFQKTSVLSITAENATTDASITLTDTSGNPLNLSSFDFKDNAFLLKITNIGDTDLSYYSTDLGTDHNDLTQYLQIKISNMKTSSTPFSEYKFVSSGMLLGHSYLFRNNILKVGETDTWKITYSTSILQDPAFQKDVRLTSTSAKLGLNIHVDTLFN